MTLSFHALWMVSALGAAVFATTVASSRRGLWLLLLAFVAAAAWSLWSAPLGPEAAGLLVALAAGAQLVRPSWVALPAITAGVLAASWGVLLGVEGVPSWTALSAGALLPAVAIICTRRNPGFAPPALRDEALTLLTVLGLCAAALPAVSDGWQSALTLSLEGPAGAAEPIPGWTLALGASSLALGALSTLWSRR